MNIVMNVIGYGCVFILLGYGLVLVTIGLTAKKPRSTTIGIFFAVIALAPFAIGSYVDENMSISTILIGVGTGLLLCAGFYSLGRLSRKPKPNHDTPATSAP